MSTSTSTSPEPPHNDLPSQSDDQVVRSSKTFAAAQPSMESKMLDPASSQPLASPEPQLPERFEKPSPSTDARTKISNFLAKDKEQEWTRVKEKEGPLHLLDLPLDVLKEIVKEVTHTNDLTSLALTHSALHGLAIPHIYSRFDIVWPDAHATTDPRTGVDALTYGLATLCMGDIFSKAGSDHSFACKNCGANNSPECAHEPAPNSMIPRRRMGNQYPQFTRKFSLGNGPTDWVTEYLITKESGKMLGTLVALAVARMINLETFVWDMPTGVLRDVWLALSSLQIRDPTDECRLERVWVRWHDNSDTAHLPPPAQGPAPYSATTTQLLSGASMSSIGWSIPAGSVPMPGQSQHGSYAQSRVEYPTLSVLPPLRSISVLDVDEIDYLDEMSTLIAKSKDRLRELRVGLAAKAINRDFAIAWDSPNLQQVDHEATWPGGSRIGERRLGGILGVLLGRVYDIRKKPKAKIEKKASNLTSAGSEQPGSALAATHQTANQQSVVFQDPLPTTIPLGGDNDSAEFGIPVTYSDHSSRSNTELTEPVGEETVVEESRSQIDSGFPANTTTEMVPQGIMHSAQSDVDSLAALLSAQQLIADADAQSHIAPHAFPEPSLRRPKAHSQKQAHFSETPTNDRQRLDGKVRLQTLELERIPLSVAVLQKGIDWSVLTNLTILDCPQHDRLWVMLRKHFQPTQVGPSHASSKHNSTMQYHLNLRKIHTDAASVPLIAFLKETLAPNTLETLFLQDRKRAAVNAVTIDAIYRGPLKRHRSSLRRLMLDSSDKIPRGPANPSDSTKWRAWMPNRDVLNFITSGKMSGLRELSMAIDYKDWHHFLQRLPQIPHVRSLNIPFIADHVTPLFDPRELALQVVDVIVLRPEVELCYMGVSNKCFEILENRPAEDSHGSGDANHFSPTGNGGHDDEDEEGDEDDSDEDEDEDEEDDNGTAIAPMDADETESDVSDSDESDSDSLDGSEDGRSKVRLRLREILFYDDKVSIFKARHGKL